MAAQRFQMRALKAMTTFGGDHIAAGQIFEAEAVEAAAYRYQKKADFVPNHHDLRDTADQVPTPTRRYRRRDLTPEEP